MCYLFHEKWISNLTMLVGKSIPALKSILFFMLVCYLIQTLWTCVWRIQESYYIFVSKKQSSNSCIFQTAWRTVWFDESSLIEGWGGYTFKYNRQDGTLYNILYYCQCCTCFRWFLRPSSGAQELYTQHVYFKLACSYRYMFQAVSPPITRSSKLYTQRRVYVELVVLQFLSS